jgi:hypothetical protein
MIDFKRIRKTLSVKEPSTDNDLKEFCPLIFQHISAHCCFFEYYFAHFYYYRHVNT